MINKELYINEIKFFEDIDHSIDYEKDYLTKKSPRWTKNLIKKLYWKDKTLLGSEIIVRYNEYNKTR